MIDLIPVPAGDGVVVMHTREDYARLMHGVDLEATADMERSLDEFLDNEEEEA